MPGLEEPRKPTTPQEAWILQNEQGESTMQIKTADELCALARSEEKLSIRTHWIAAAVVITLAGCFLYNVFSIADPWIRLGQAWILGVICYLFGSKLQRAPRRIGTNEPCAHFLEREFEGKRRGFLEVRRGVFLFVPGIVATYWGGGPMLRAKAWGLNESSWFFRFGTGPWPLVLIGVVLAIVWLAFGKAAEKAKRDEQEIRRSMEL